MTEDRDPLIVLAEAARASAIATRLEAAGVKARDAAVNVAPSCGDLPSCLSKAQEYSRQFRAATILADDVVEVLWAGEESYVALSPEDVTVALTTRTAKQARLRSRIAYIDEAGVPRSFEDCRCGDLADTPSSTLPVEAWSAVWGVFVPGGYSESMAEMAPSARQRLLDAWTRTSALSECIRHLTRAASDPIIAQEDSLAAYNFSVPRHRIALSPREVGTHRLLVFDRASRTMQHEMVDRLPELLPRDSLVIVNNSAVVKAALRPRPDNGTYLHVLDPHRGTLEHVSMLCPWKPNCGDRIDVEGGRVDVLQAPSSQRDIRVGRITPEDPTIVTLAGFLDAHGEVPIPIYVNAARPPAPSDRQDYQNAYASVPGSVACPTAGLHLHQGLLDGLRQAGHEVVAITLHIGYGTWKSLKSPSVSDHEMDAEWMTVDRTTIAAIRTAKQKGRSVVAVGTSCVRTLESLADDLCADDRNCIARETSLYICPPYRFQVVDAMMTNFAYPKTPIMTMAAAFVGGVRQLQAIYAEALERDYLFFTYGDALLFV